MNDLEKLLRKISKKERENILAFLKEITPENLKTLEVKKITGKDDLYRVRKGDYRVIFALKNNKIFVKKVAKRGEKTYKGLR